MKNVKMRNVASVIIGVSIVALVMAPTAQATVTIADQPVQSAGSTLVKPNLMFLLDDSGSMGYYYMPDPVGGLRGSRYAIASSQCNGLAYQPSITYSPPVNALGVSFNNSTFNAAWVDGFGRFNPLTSGAATLANVTNLSTSYRASTETARPAYYYTYSGTQPALGYTYNTSGSFTVNAVYNECADSPITTTITISNGSKSCKATSITVNGVEILTGSSTASTNNSTVAANIAAMVGVTDFAATASSNVVTLYSSSAAAASKKPVVTMSCTGGGSAMTATAGTFPAATGHAGLGLFSLIHVDAGEQQNFANWYSYYRDRINMMKTAMSQAFMPIDSKYRVGFYTMNSHTFLNSIDYDGTQKAAWYGDLFNVYPSGGTPLLGALDKMGKYYKGSGSGISGAVDPLQYSCQKNFTIMSTDGFWNGGSPPGTANADWDKTIPSSMPIKAGSSVYSAADTGLVPGAQFPAPFYEGPSASVGTLSDIAMYYWVTDLRTGGAMAANNVPTSSSDPAYWQHMNLFSIGLGVKGTLTYPTDLAAIQAGTLNWPGTPNGSDSSNNMTKIDDLWHSGINGHGNYYSATDPTTLANGLKAALAAISDASTYGTGAAVSTNMLGISDETDFTQYYASYKVTDWSGDLLKYATDRATGGKVGSPIWSANKQLDIQYPYGSSTWSGRPVVTQKEDGTVIPFTWGSLSSTQKTRLCRKSGGVCVAGDSSLVDYLRGDSTYEGDYGAVGKYYRNRHDVSIYDRVTGAILSTTTKRNLLGDIVDSQAIQVGSERRDYQESTDPGFQAFKTASTSRARAVYVGANDGMVHVFDSGTGNELWAYIPSFLIREENDASGYENGLRALSYQDNGAPGFTHHFYVDASAETGAVDFNHVGSDTLPTSGDWHSILVGGLGKGGKGFYALDVTTPATSLASAQSAVLWEFPNAGTPVTGQMGYSYGKPIIAKTRSWGWVVMLPSGFNNTDGYGYVFILNAKTGALLETLKTTLPSDGLAYITGFVKDYSNLYVEQVYGGDRNGNLWRFDISDATASSHSVTQIFSSSTTTPITSEPTVEQDETTGNRWVFFGTGQYLNVPDRANTDTQYLVALNDGDASGIFPYPTPKPLSGLATVTNLSSGLSEAAVITAGGWKYALADVCSGSAAGSGGERVVVKPAGDFRTIVFATLIPGTDPCSPGICGYVFGLEYSTGMSKLMIGGSPVNNVYASTGIAGINIIETGKDPLVPTAGTPAVQVLGSDGQAVALPKVDTKNNTAATRHVGWREVLDNY